MFSSLRVWEPMYFAGRSFYDLC